MKHLLQLLLLAAPLLALSGRGAAAPAGMVLVPGGPHQPFFRSPEEAAVVTVEPFFLDALPVTNARYLEFVRENPKWRRSQVKRLFADAEYLRFWADDLDLGAGVEAEAPVTQVSWFAAKAYCAWRGGRLPTQDEWEHAASAGYTLKDGKADLEHRAAMARWYSTPAPERLPAVGQGRPNFYGIYDLHGLAWEWVSDFNTLMVTGDARGDTGIERLLFCGGGAQNARDRGDFMAFMRHGFRSSLKAGYTVHNLGFRCAMTPGPMEETP